MKLKLALCLFVSFYIVQDNSANDTDLSEYKGAILRSKSHIKSILGSISQTKHNVHFSTVSKLNVLSGKTGEQIEKLLQEGLEGVLRISKNAKKTGKKVKHVERCFNNGKMDIVAVKTNAQRRLKKCVDDSKDLLATYTSTLTVSENNGKELIQDLDHIILNCAGGNPYAVKNCVDKLLKSSNAAADTFEANSAEKKENAHKGSKAAITAAEKCNAGLISSTKSAVTYLQEDLVQCLQHS